MKAKTMIIATMFSVALSITTTLAQDGTKSLEEVAQLSTENLDKKIDLSDEQEAMVYKASLRHLQNMQSLKNSNSSRLDKFRDYQDYTVANENEMKAILSKEQFKEWRKISNENREQVKQNRKK